MDNFAFALGRSLSRKSAAAPAVPTPEAVFNRQSQLAGGALGGLAGGGLGAVAGAGLGTAAALLREKKTLRDYLRHALAGGLIGGTAGAVGGAALGADDTTQLAVAEMLNRG